jgi:2-keto-4-pentenoate hydratase/2-oxohepta-3-ene-1,7-dioic acid hydratase in catechol pathway
MKLTAFDHEGGIFLGAVSGDQVTPIAPRESFWAEGAKARPQGGALPLERVTQRPAIPAGARVICIGLNYKNHAEEGGGQAPADPVVFARWSATLIADGDAAPAIEPRFDWEGELGVVIGKAMFRVPAEAAMAGAFGYCAFNDLSARTFQRASPQWTMGKNGELSGPMGMIVTADEVGDPKAGLRLTTRRNGEIMQDDNTRDLIFPVDTLIAHISQVMILRPGDLIATGTPAGVGAARRPPVFLGAGDVIEVEIERVGKVTTPIVAAPAPILP